MEKIIEAEENEVVKLIEELTVAAQAYYQDGVDSPLTDEEFDTKLEYLRLLSSEKRYENDFAVGSDGFKLLESEPGLGSKTKAKETIIHSLPMLSLGKATSETDLRGFVKRADKAGAKGYELQAKLDGVALSIRYKNGVLEYIATRGDGAVGENVTYLSNAKYLKISGIPKTVTGTGVFELRGEVFFTNEQFKKVNENRKKFMGEEFKNSRNAATGLLNKARLGLDYPVELTFAAYGAYLENSPVDLNSLKLEGLTTVIDVTKAQKLTCKLTGFKTVDELIENVEKFGEDRKSFTIPTDGVVIKPTNESELLVKMGYTSHHPISQVAYKYPGESGVSKIIGFNITVGKAGKVTPTAYIEPVLVSGTLISNVSCHNFNWMTERDIRVGSVVSVSRANDVIPKIDTVILNPEGATAMEMPVNCPHCGVKLHYDVNDVYPPKTLTCPNADCPSRGYFGLKNAVGKNYLDIDGLSEGTLEELFEEGHVVTINDLYKLTVGELAEATNGYTQEGKPRRLGETRAKNIVEHIEKSKELPLWKILSALNIEQLSFSTAKKITESYGTIEEILALSESEIAAIEGLGAIKAGKIYSGLRLREELIGELRESGVKFTPVVRDSSGESKVSGVSFNISGSVPEGFANRNAFVEWVEGNGGVYHSAPKATTDYVVGDVDSTSSKIVKAKKLGVEIISPEEFAVRFMK